MLRRPSVALLFALAGAVGLVAVRALAFDWPRGGRADASVLAGFLDLHRPRSGWLLGLLAHLADPKPFVVLGTALVAVALARRRPRVAVAVGAVLLAANLTTQMLKPALAAARPSPTLGLLHIDAASWPSGHATASMSLALGAVMVAPAALRPAAAVAGAMFAVAVSYAFLALGWHYPSDVLGGFLVAATWTALGVAAVLAVERRRPSRPGAPGRVGLAAAVAPVLGAGVALAASAAALALARPAAVEAYARRHTTFVVGAAAIAALALGLAGVLAAALTPTRPPPAPGRR